MTFPTDLDYTSITVSERTPSGSVTISLPSGEKVRTTKGTRYVVVYKGDLARGHKPLSVEFGSSDLTKLRARRLRTQLDRSQTAIVDLASRRGVAL